jgi:O-antigen/teichoic acid export membrane protein
MRWSFVAAAVTLTSALLLVPRFGAAGAAWSMLAGGVVQLVLTYLSLNRHVVSLPFLMPWLPAAAAYCVAMTAYRLLNGFGALLAALVSFTMFLAALWLAERRWIVEGVSLLRRPKVSAA